MANRIRRYQRRGKDRDVPGLEAVHGFFESVEPDELALFGHIDLIGVLALFLIPPLWVLAPFIAWVSTGQFPSTYFVIWIGGPLELFGGILVMIGLLTRPVAFVLSGFMACAYWMAHAFKALLPVMNQGELAVIYCFVFLFISARGSGIWSLDGGD